MSDDDSVHLQEEKDPKLQNEELTIEKPSENVINPYPLQDDD